MKFTKMQGLGNDFVVVAGPAEIGTDQVRRWCERRTGVGADGVLEVSPLASNRVRMRYWNADGSPSEMCGNGLRCVARYAVDNGVVSSPELVIETEVGPLAAHVRGDGTVRVEIGTAHPHRIGSLTVAGQQVHPVGFGNPHAVLYVDDVDLADVGVLGPRIGGDALFPEGANVEFMHVVSEEVIDLRVWERGVGETLACGSGAAAAAFIAARDGHTKSDVTVQLRGGPLRVEIIDGVAWLDGPAEAVFTGDVT